MSILVFWLVLIVMAAGALGTLLPIIPGTPLIFLAALIYGFYEGFNKLTPLVLVILFVLMLMSFAIDYFAGIIGAKTYGASKYGTWGSFLGGLLGIILFNIPGLLVGPFIGAVAGEIISGRRTEEAVKVGFGTVVGLAGGAFFKVLLAISMITVYVVSVV